MAARAEPGGAPALRVRALRKNDWQLIERLFGANGACGGCWCMWPRIERGGKLWESLKGAPAKRAFRALVADGQVHAVLAFAGKEPVGWCSFGPRASFPRLETVKALRRELAPDTWSIVCFYIPARWRDRGVATALLQAATEAAFRRGAREIEGYPIVPRGPGGRAPAAFAWTGVPSLFRKAGYRALKRPRASRPLVVRQR